MTYYLYAIKHMNKCYKTYINYLSWFVIILSILISVEILLITFFTGYPVNKLSFLLSDGFHFFIKYLLDDPLDTLYFVLIEKPLIKIEAIHNNPVTVIWGLHYYGFTILTHILLAALASRAISKYKLTTTTLKTFPMIGALLLILSSLFLYLASCCTGGASWIIHTSLLAIAFNPYNATESALEFYKNIQGWFNWMQFMMATLGTYLIILKIQKSN